MLLVEGNTSTQVKYLQHGLRMLCFNPKRLDGVFDTNTTLAVKRYQTSRGLTSDGKVGDGTWNKLKMRYYSTPNVTKEQRILQWNH